MVVRPVPFDTSGTLTNFVRAFEMQEDDEPAIIIIEALANCIDAKANDIYIDLRNKKENKVELIVRDNGNGMTDTVFEHNYHRFSTSSKSIGDGIGFAGVGAKLAFYFHKDTFIRTTTKTDKSSDILCSIMDWNKATFNIQWEPIGPYNKDREFLEEEKHGTIYHVEADPKTGRYLWKNCEKIISQWYNSILLGHYPIKIFLNSKELKARSVPYEKKFYKEIKIGNKLIKAYFYILQEKPDEGSQELNFIIYGKFIKQDSINWGGRLKPEYEKKIRVEIEADILATELGFTKQNFKSHSKLYLEIKKKTGIELNDWLKSIGALRETSDLAPTKAMSKLSQVLSALLNNKNFKDFNPFLKKVLTTTILIDENGPKVGILIDGAQTAKGTHSGNGGGGGTNVFGDDPQNKAPVLDENGNIKVAEHKRNKKDISIIPQEDEKDPREAWVDQSRKAIILNQGHKFYQVVTKSSSEVQKMQLVKAIVDALAYEAAEKPEFGNNYKSISDKKIGLVTALVQDF